MGAKFRVGVTADTTLVTTAETVVATLSGVNSSRAGQPCRLHGTAQITTAANTTALTLRVRRASLTGTLVDEGNPVQIEAAAGSTEDHDIVVIDDDPGEMAGATYVLTVQATAATANGACLAATLEAEVG